MLKRLAFVLLAAWLGGCCPQAAVKQATPSPDPTPTPQPQPTPTVETPTKLDPKAEAELAARRAFKNPGGMWLPAQLGLRCTPTRCRRWACSSKASR
jgi:hypothetical protein